MKRIDRGRAKRYLVAKDSTMPGPDGLRTPWRRLPSHGRSIFASALFTQAFVDAMNTPGGLGDFTAARRQVTLHTIPYIRPVTDVVIAREDIL